MGHRATMDACDGVFDGKTPKINCCDIVRGPKGIITTSMCIMIDPNTVSMHNKAPYSYDDLPSFEGQDYYVFTNKIESVWKYIEWLKHLDRTFNMDDEEHTNDLGGVWDPKSNGVSSFKEMIDFCERQYNILKRKYKYIYLDVIELLDGEPSKRELSDFLKHDIVPKYRSAIKTYPFNRMVNNEEIHIFEYDKRSHHTYTLDKLNESVRNSISNYVEEVINNV